VGGQPSARPSAKAPAAVETVLVRRDLRRRSGPPPLQLRIDRRLWDALDQPPFLRLEFVDGQVRLLPATEANRKRVRMMGTVPFLVCSDAELALGEGVYAGGAIVIGGRLDDGEVASPARTTSSPWRCRTSWTPIGARRWNCCGPPRGWDFQRWECCG